MTKSHVRSPFSQIVIGAMAGLSLIAAQSDYAQAQVQAVTAQAAQKVLTPAERAKILQAKRQALKNRNKVIVKPAPGQKVIVKRPAAPGAPAKVIVKTPPAVTAPAKSSSRAPLLPAPLRR